jgi:putative hydrolase of the HAD superfamily
MTFNVLFFDLDDTLYSHTNGLWEAIRQRMTAYLLDPLGFPPDKIQEIRQSYYETYGTTLRGLQNHHQVDENDFLAYVHDLPLEQYLTPDPQLRRMLDSLEQPKWIFTNADAHHAQRVLQTLDVEDCFTGIIDVRALGFLCKPDHQAYTQALKLAGEKNPTNCVLLDDSIRNLGPAHQIGFTTVLVGNTTKYQDADYSIERITDLPNFFPQLWSI